VYDPTATHALTDVQATSASSLPLKPGSWMRCSDHRRPFQRSATGLGYPDPTAMHAVLDTHETPLSELPIGPCGIRSRDHRLPFQRSARGPSPDDPTAAQNDLDGHDTSLNTPRGAAVC
jgi:hypothetical protein